MEAISVKNLSVAYENNTIIEDLSLSIPKGKISIIIGANGCGKSTFLKTLARINKPKAGEIFINKKDKQSHRKRQQERKRHIEQADARYVLEKARFEDITECHSLIPLFLLL